MKKIYINNKMIIKDRLAAAWEGDGKETNSSVKAVNVFNFFT